jgi:hypothetical protein
MLNPQQFTSEIIIPALEVLGLDSKEARALLLGTAIQESRLTYLRQIGGGPALGVFQIEPATHNDLYANFLSYRPEMRDRLLSLGERQHDSLIYNLRYAAAVARLIYYRAPGQLPDSLEGQAAYYKKNYNTPLGAGPEQEYIDNFTSIT